MNLSDDDIKNVLLNPILNGSGSHYISDCPFCGKNQHLYVQRQTKKTSHSGINQSWMFQCKKCEEYGRIFKLLRKLGRDDLIEFKRSVQTKLTSLSHRNELSLNIEEYSKVEQRSYPLGFKRLTYHPYLQSRGFTSKQYRLYEVGTSSQLFLKNYIIFIIKEDELCKGYVARHTFSKQKLDKINRKAKEQDLPKKLRYCNSSDDFSKLIFGYDEIIENLTKTVIIVEGVFDKTNVDKQLSLYDRDDVKCICVFGKKISDVQIHKLKSKGIRKVIVMFDPDALNASKNFGYVLQRFFETYVVFLPNSDPGELTRQQLIEYIRQKKKPLNFYLNHISSNLK